MITSRGFKAAPPHLSRQRAAASAILAFDLVRDGAVTDANGFTPFYIRKPQAERMQKDKGKGEEKGLVIE
jgi:hypothetical protein